MEADELEAMEEASYEVMSEVHLGCPPHLNSPYISRFTFPGLGDDDGTSWNDIIRLDEDGDLILTRHSKSSHNCGVTIQHSITSTIPSVGLQVWRAELVLADFVLHKLSTSKAFDKIVALELGAGTGLLGILLASVAKTVFLTAFMDGLFRGDEGVSVPSGMQRYPTKDIVSKFVYVGSVLRFADVNADPELDEMERMSLKVFVGIQMQEKLNSHLLKNHQASVYVRELDWNTPWPPSPAPNSPKKYSWSPSEVEEADNASVLLAADVIYSDELTDAFFRSLRTIMSRGSKKILYLALEKRYNFSVDDLDVVANGYSHFRSYLMDDAEEWKKVGNGFVGKEIEISDVPQYVREYNRENNVEIWQIEYFLE